MIRNTITFLGICLFLTTSCKEEVKVESNTSAYKQLSGEVIGTYYSMKYEGPEGIQSMVDSLFNVLNSSLSTYVEHSTISRFNRSKTGISYSINEDRHFETNWHEAKRIYQLSGGDFDPTVGPLVNYYGFGYTGKEKIEHISAKAIDSIMNYVGFDKMTLTKQGGQVTLQKAVNRAELDFSAIAKGYYVDQVGLLLEQMGVRNYLVDIGGESVGKGVNNKGVTWVVGVNKPKEGSAYTDLELALKLENRAVASSGNYRNYYINQSGQKFVHTIDPKTGMSKESDVLSATVIASNCMLADALATTCMVKGLAEALSFIESIEDVEACFIIENKEGELVHKYSSGFEAYVLPI